MCPCDHGIPVERIQNLQQRLIDSLAEVQDLIIVKKNRSPGWRLGGSRNQ